MSRFINIFVGLAGLVFIGLILFPVFSRQPRPHTRYSCQSNLKQLGLGFMQYAQDYNEKLPVATASSGWGNAVLIYVKSNQIYQCSAEASSTAAQTDPKLTGYTDYFYNAQLEQVPLSRLEESWRTVLLAEGNDGQENTDAAYAKTEIPLAWRSDASSPAYRHNETANYLFADGHAKALKVEAISTSWKKGGFYFQAPKLVEGNSLNRR